MIEFYKKRDFGSLITDTFEFFKIYGKNYFKNYFLMCGSLSILFVAVFILGYREFFMQLINGNVDGEGYFLDSYFQNNMFLLGAIVLLLFALGLVVVILSYTFPIFYLKRLTETGNANITTEELWKDIKSNIGKIIILFLGMFFILTPVIFMFFGTLVVLMFLIIGFFLFLLAIPFLVNVINFLMYDYFNTQKGFFKSLSLAIRAQFSYPINGSTPFWKYLGAMAVILFIIQIVIGVFTMLPSILLQLFLFSVSSQKGGFEDNPFDGELGILFFIIYGISLVVGFMLNNVIFITSGLMYYDHRTDLHQKSNFQEIENIGIHEA